MTRAGLIALLPALALLAGCGGGRDRPPTVAVPDAVASACESQVDADPAVTELMIKGAGTPQFQRDNQDRLRLARQRARIACLQSRGVLPRGGGVEPQRPQ